MESLVQASRLGHCWRHRVTLRHDATSTVYRLQQGQVHFKTETAKKAFTTLLQGDADICMF